MHSGACFRCRTGAADRDRLRVLLAPSLPELRLPELDNKAARRLYWSLVSVAALVVGAGLVATFLHDIGVPEPLHQAAGILLLVVATGGIIAVIWSERPR